MIDIVDVGASKNTHKVFYLFGEHARELVSPETAMALLEDLCSDNLVAKAALENSQFRIIPNGNPGSRKMVESGEYCLRLNPNGVDLNRNWDVSWRPNPVESNDEQLSPGSSPFSEVETRIFKQAVTEFNPNVFAAIHSGTLGMYMPWAFSTGQKPVVRNEEKMHHVLSELDSKFCKCPSGAAQKEVGYSSPGTCLDWVHMHTKADYSYAFEIYTGFGLQDLRERYRRQQLRAKAAFLELDYKEDNCFSQFNPVTEESLKRTVKNWSQALVELAVITATK
jgi:murein tripeptide amidase MpaA